MTDISLVTDNNSMTYEIYSNSEQAEFSEPRFTIESNNLLNAYRDALHELGYSLFKETKKEKES